MKSDELIKLLNDKNNKLKEIDNEIAKLKQDKKAIFDIVMRSTSFVPYSLAYAISYLVLAQENKLYIPISGKYFSRIDEYSCLILVNAEELKEGFYRDVEEYNDILPIYSSPSKEYNANNQELTFSHLRKEFDITVNMIDEYNSKCNIYPYIGREYIREFITYLAMLQIVKDGKPLTVEEMLIAVSNFINLEKEKPKTKELNKD